MTFALVFEQTLNGLRWGHALSYGSRVDARARHHERGELAHGSLYMSAPTSPSPRSAGQALISSRRTRACRYAGRRHDRGGGGAARALPARSPRPGARNVRLILFFTSSSPSLGRARCSLRPSWLAAHQSLHGRLSALSRAIIAVGCRRVLLWYVVTRTRLGMLIRAGRPIARWSLRSGHIRLLYTWCSASAPRSPARRLDGRAIYNVQPAWAS